MEVRAVCDIAVHIRTVVDGTLEEVDVGPPHGEIAVQAIARVVAVGPDPRSRAVVGEVLGVDEHFVEQRYDVNRMRWGAVTAVVYFHGVRHV